jgi:hypothetical protein
MSKEKSWMICVTCKNIVLHNCTGLCLSCQCGFSGIQSEDDYDFITLVENEKK